MCGKGHKIKNYDIKVKDEYLTNFKGVDGLVMCEDLWPYLRIKGKKDRKKWYF